MHGVADPGETLGDDDGQPTATSDEADASGRWWWIREYDEWFGHPLQALCRAFSDWLELLSPQFRSDRLGLRPFSSAGGIETDERVYFGLFSCQNATKTRL